MDFLKKRQTQLGIKSAADLMKGGVPPVNIKNLVVNGPKLIDQNVRKFQRGDFVGLIGSSGIGKTSFCLWFFKHILLNNPEGVCVFIACEMSAGQLLAKWHKATKDCPEISERLYFITSHDEDGNTNDLTIRGIKRQLATIKNVLDTEIISFLCDHLHIVHREDNQTIDDVVYGFSSMCKEINSLGFLTAQTTKNKSGEGDLPLDKGSVFGTSAFTWEAAYIITLCQPLASVGNPIPTTSWQLAKNRFKEEKDRYKEGINNLLKFNYGDESYRELNRDELLMFEDYYKEVIEIRKQKEKTGEAVFDTSYKITGPSGNEVIVKKEVGNITGWD